MTTENGDVVLPWVEHADHKWVEHAPCVYCDPCGVRLYQGRLPIERDPERQAREAACGHDWDWVSHMGFYGSCDLCGAQDWGERRARA